MNESSRYVQDWERIRRIGLNPAIKSPSEYLRATALGQSYAEHLMKHEGKIVPSGEELKALHAAMFVKVHPWAGTFRVPGQEVRAGKLVCTAAKEIDVSLFALNKEMLSNPLTGSKKYKIELVSFYHASLVAIHPFLDGNGRLSRLVTSYQCERLLGASLDLGQVQRDDYIKSLNAAHEDGNLSKLNRLIGDTLHSLSKEKAATPEQELRTRESLLLRERKALGFTGTDLEQQYGLGGYPKPLTEKVALQKASSLQGISQSEIQKVAALLLKDDLELTKKREKVESELYKIRETLVEMSLTKQTKTKSGPSRER